MLMFWRLGLVVIILVSALVWCVPAMACTGARAQGLGSAGLALNDGDANAVYWAPDALNEVSPGAALCYSIPDYYDAYNYTLLVVTSIGDLNIGFGMINFHGEDGIILALPLGRINQLQFGSYVWLNAGGYPITGSVTCAYKGNNFTIRCKYDISDIRFGVTYQIEAFTFAMEYYYIFPGYSGFSYSETEKRLGIEYLTGIAALRIGTDMFSGEWHYTYGLGIKIPDKFSIDWGFCDDIGGRIEISYAFR